MNLIMNLRSYGTLFVQKVTAVSCAPSAFFQYSFCKVHNIAVHTVLRIIYFLSISAIIWNFTELLFLKLSYMSWECLSLIMLCQLQLLVEIYSLYLKEFVIFFLACHIEHGT